MKALKIFGIFIFSILAVVGITQSNVPEGENNIYAGIMCLIIALIILFRPAKSKGKTLKRQNTSHRSPNETKSNHDNNINLLDWQNLLLQGSHDKLVMTKNQLIQESTRLINRDAEIVNDCVNLLNKTTNAETFFPRLDLLKERIEHSKQFEPYMQFATGAKPSDTEKEMLAKEQNFIRDFLERSFISIDAKAQTLKTERGRLNQYKRFADSMAPYLSRLNDSNMQYYNEYCKTD